MSKYQIGVVKASTRKELGLNAIKHIGLFRPNSPLAKHVGKICIYKDRKSNGSYHRENLFEVVAAQSCWGYDKKGRYTMIDGIRLTAIGEKDDFGCAATLADIKFI